jgi:endonuclease/exonuclease/phosphatase family metal-dependent hydrolase
MNDCREVSVEKPFGPSGTFNNFVHNEPVTKLIDYIFISKDSILKVKKYAVLSDSKNGRYPSDHLPVYVEINFK